MNEKKFEERVNHFIENFLEEEFFNETGLHKWYSEPEGWTHEDNPREIMLNYDRNLKTFYRWYIENNAELRKKLKLEFTSYVLTKVFALNHKIEVFNSNFDENEAKVSKIEYEDVV